MFSETRDQLVYKLSSKTREGRANWQRTSAPNQYALKMGAGTVLIERLDTTPEKFDVAILNRAGETVDEFSAEAYSSEYHKVQELYRLASEAQRKKESVVREILSEIDASEVIGRHRDLDLY